MTTSITELTKEIRERLEKATPNLGGKPFPANECEYFGDSLICLSGLYENWQNDVELFGNAPADITRLLSALERADKAIDNACACVVPGYSPCRACKARSDIAAILKGEKS